MSKILIKKSIFYVFISLILVKISYGATYLPEKLKEMLANIFINLPAGLREGDMLAILYFKFFLFILVFAIMFSSTKKVLHGSKRIQVIVSLVLALTSSILVPNKTMTFIFAEYSAVIAILLGLLPAIVGIYIWYKIK